MIENGGLLIQCSVFRGILSSSRAYDHPFRISRYFTIFEPGIREQAPYTILNHHDKQFNSPTRPMTGDMSY